MREKSSNQKTSQQGQPAAGQDGAEIASPVYEADALAGAAPAIQRKPAPETGSHATGGSSPNRTGLPDALKSGIESLSGLAMDDVRVHSNSSKPAQLQALAYAQGTDIHLGPGQERHLPHEAWHVVQQKQGRVKPTIQMKGTQINDDSGLEKEADAMGIRALQQKNTSGLGAALHGEKPTRNTIQQKSVVQRLIINTGTPALPKEFVKENGWIVASDVDLAFQEGGYHQDVKELDELSASKKVGKNENIYLEGHGSAGRLGAVLPSVAANALNQIIPANYTGKIRSHSCSAGVPDRKKGLPSGVQGLANQLNVGNIPVTGANGIALNHSAYKGTGGTRSFTEGTQSEQEIDSAIGKTIQPVHNEWRKYVLSKKGKIELDSYPEAAKKATEISDQFYIDLEHNIETHLIAEKDSLVTSVSTGSSFCFITTACVQAKNLPDDCIELTTLRAFRDEYIATLANGKKMIKVYYENAPTIVDAINQRANAHEIYNDLYEIICQCVRLVQEKDYQSAFQTYVNMMVKLRNQFTPMANIPSFFYPKFHTH